MRDHLKLILALVVTALVFLLYAGYSWVLVDFQVQNKSSVGYFQVSKLLGNLYLLREGYFGQVDQVIVIYSDTPQSQNQTFAQVYGGDTLNISYSGSFSGRVYTAEITYRREIGDRLAQDQDSKWLSYHLYTNLCMIMTHDSSGGKCTSRADFYVSDQWSFLTNKFVRVNRNLLSFLKNLLVTQAYAASCSGSIPCGANSDKLKCTAGGKFDSSCHSNGQSCGEYSNLGTCAYEFVGRCDESQNVLQCSSLSDKNSKSLCEGAGFGDCAAKCTNYERPDLGNYCSWGGSGGSNPDPTPTPTPDPGGNDSFPRFKIWGYAENSNGIRIRSTDVARIVFNDGESTTLRSDSQGYFNYDKKSSALSEAKTSFKVEALPSVTGLGGTLKVPSGVIVPGSCAVSGDSKAYEGCQRVKYVYANFDGNPGGTFIFKEVLPPSPSPLPPLCSKGNSWPSQVFRGEQVTFAAQGVDQDTIVGGFTPMVKFYFTKTRSDYCGLGTSGDPNSNWVQVGGGASTYNHSVTLNTTGLTPGVSYLMTTNVTDDDNQTSSGNPCGKYPTNNCSQSFQVVLRQCNESCSSNTQCTDDLGSAYICFGGTCRRDDNRYDIRCSEPPPPPECNATCFRDWDCPPSPYACYNTGNGRKCRNLDYPDQANCQPPSALECNSACTSTNQCVTALGNAYICSSIYHTCRLSSNESSATCQPSSPPPSSPPPSVLECNSACTSTSECTSALGNDFICSNNRCRRATNPSSATCARLECNSSCSNSTQCQKDINSNFICSNGQCRRASNPSSVTCESPPSATECNSACTSTSECTSALGNDFICSNNKCRRATNPSSATCARLECNSSCSNSTQCQKDINSNYICSNGQCRLASNSSSAACASLPPPPPPPPPIQKSCVVSTSGSGSIEQGTTINISGNALSSSSVADLANLYLIKHSQQPISGNYALGLSPSNVPGFPNLLTTSPSRNPTLWRSGCSSSSDSRCYFPTSQINTPSSPLPVGTYKVWCSMDTVGNATEKCTGDPLCTQNGGPLGCTPSKSCGTSSYQTFQIKCTPNCPAQQCGQNNGCGGSCSSADKGKPTMQITSPATQPGDKLNMSTLSDSIVFRWQDTNSPPKANNYDVIIYKSGSFGNPDAAFVKCGSSPAVNCNKAISATNLTFHPNTPMGANLGDKLVVAVRGTNTTCSSYSGTETSAWVTKNYNLVGNISVAVHELSPSETISCTGGTSPSFSENQVYRAMNSNYGANESFSNRSPQLSLNDLRYTGTQWSPRYQLYMDTKPKYTPGSLPNTMYVCAECSRGDNSEISQTCIPNRLNNDFTAPSKINASNDDVAHFYVINYNLSNKPWFQWADGSAYSKNGLVSMITPTCSGNCKRILSLSSNNANNAGKAGIPISNGAINYGAGQQYAQRLQSSSPYSGQYATGVSMSGAIKRDYNYYLAKINTTNRPAPPTKLTLDTQYPSSSEPDGTIVYAKSGDLTIDTVTAGNWVVGGNKKVLILVSGNLTIKGKPNEKAITVNTGSFLGFIVGGTITFDNSIGWKVSGSNRPERYVNPADARVEGVFVADKIVVKGGGASTIDNKFVGSGTFVGWSEISLERSFNDGKLGRELHNNSPTELFFYRPDFVVNAPLSVREITTRWQQVN